MSAAGDALTKAKSANTGSNRRVMGFLVGWWDVNEFRHVRRAPTLRYESRPLRGDNIAHPDWRRGVRPALGKLAPPRRMGFARRAVFRSVGRKPYDLNSASSIRLRSSPESARWGTFAVRSTERYFAL